MLKNLKNKKFGKLTVIERDYSKTGRSKSAFWFCSCDCGNHTIKNGAELRNGDTKSCGCIKKQHILSGQSPINYLYDRYKRDALKRNLNFDLTKEEFSYYLNLNCHYCGQIPSQKLKKLNFTYNGIDRMDNSLGYSVANCVTSCGLCNYMKTYLRKDAFLAHINKIYHNKENKNERINM